jgi:hypothetical protein
MKRFTGFALASLTIIGASLALLLAFFTEPRERRALRVGAGFAFVVQLAAFSVARFMARRNVIAGWGLGVAMRFLALGIFALAVVPRLDLSLTAGLVGLALFLFLSTLVEPLFLKP